MLANRLTLSGYNLSREVRTGMERRNLQAGTMEEHPLPASLSGTQAHAYLVFLLSPGYLPRE